MTGTPAEELEIRSLHGVLRDLLPVYTLAQAGLALAVAAGLGCTAWLWGWHVAPLLLFLTLIGWWSLFEFRPATMALGESQAQIVEEAMAEQGHYYQSDEDGRWRIGTGGFQWSHEHIEMVRTAGGVTMIGPRAMLGAARAYLEWVEEVDEYWVTTTEQPFEIPETESKPPWHAHVPAVALGAVMVPVWLADMATQNIGHWGLSGAALAQGRYETILLHMFAHGGLMHIGMNMAALVAVGAALSPRLGPAPRNWGRLLLLFFGSGLSGAALFLAFHPMGTVPMVGASGAIYGLIGLLVRLPRKGRELLTLRSRRIRRVGWVLIQQNLFFIALLALLAWASGTNGGLAWEAHLGGFIFGFFAGPLLLPRSWADAPDEQARA